MFPFTNASWDAEAGKIVLSFRHMAAAVDLQAVRATYLLLSSLTLWWAVLVGGLQPLDVLALHDHNPNHLWQSYQEDMLHFVDKLVEGGRDLQTALHH